MTADTAAHHLTQVLGRIEAATRWPRLFTCAVCGCLCRRDENCPSCALTNATQASS